VEPASRARAFAAAAYGSDEDLAHPDEVASLVGTADEGLRAAAILHDLVEDTNVDLPAVAAEFGSRVATLVGAMTEDGSIEDYAERKAEGRLRARDCGRDAALLFVADKLSNVRRMRRGQKEPDGRKLQHYRATLETMREAYPDLPLLDDLETELRARAPETPGTEAPATGPERQPGARA
jgi:(p)ppGpp synthase/HD superfamily hydrolase